jgi:glutamine amidotransferase
MNQEIAIIDYGAGNMQSVVFALERLGVIPTITSDRKIIRNASKVIFPGVGHAVPALKALKENGLDKLIPTLSQPVLGICLGMQLMCSYSEENSEKGLGIFPVNVQRFTEINKVPHLGWNSIFTKNGPLFEEVPDGSFVYFVHSFYAEITNDTTATSSHSLSFSASIQKDNFYGCQFHPEKSGVIGQQILRNFINLPSS